jgi:phenylacetate-CoA ligase
MRFFAWHDIPFADAMATIRRPNAETPAEGRKWAASFAAVERGPEVELSSTAPVTAQLEWLGDRGPVWLRTRPSLAQQMALTVKERPQLRPRLLGLLTSGEILTDDQRHLCREFLGHAPRDVYELAEVGAVALQCPQSSVYHVQTEAALLEVLDEDGRGCPKGATGRLVVTPLYNLAMPLIRYDTGDLAVAGDRFDQLISGRLCVCGRRLPRLRSILGRLRNQLSQPDGRPLAPAIGSNRLHDLTGARLWQLVQEGAGRFTMRLDSDSATQASGSADAAAAYVTEALGNNCQVKIEWTNLSQIAGRHRFEPYLRKEGSSRTRPT